MKCNFAELIESQFLRFPYFLTRGKWTWNMATDAHRHVFVPTDSSSSCCCSPNSILFRMNGNNTMDFGPSCKTNMTNKVICGPHASASPFRVAVRNIENLYFHLGLSWKQMAMSETIAATTIYRGYFIGSTVPVRINWKRWRMEEPHGICLITFRTWRSFWAGADTR